MDNAITTRSFSEEDIPELTALMIELGYPTTEEEMVARLKSLPGDDLYKTMVAISERKVVGMIGMIHNFYWERNGSYVRVQALVVSSSMRKRGVGALLMACAERWAEEKKAVLVSLNCANHEGRTAAHRFYQGLGFVHTSSGYTKKLPPGK